MGSRSKCALKTCIDVIQMNEWRLYKFWGIPTSTRIIFRLEAFKDFKARVFRSKGFGENSDRIRRVFDFRHGLIVLGFILDAKLYIRLV